MNLFETVKAAVTPRMAAERYGLPIQQGGMVSLPLPRRPHAQHEAERGLLLLLRLRGYR